MELIRILHICYNLLKRLIHRQVERPDNPLVRFPINLDGVLFGAHVGSSNLRKESSWSDRSLESR
jgi:hypothetical protein